MMDKRQISYIRQAVENLRREQQATKLQVESLEDEVAQLATMTQDVPAEAKSTPGMLKHLSQCMYDHAFDLVITLISLAVAVGSVMYAHHDWVNEGAVYVVNEVDTKTQAFVVVGEGGMLTTRSLKTLVIHNKGRLPGSIVAVNDSTGGSSLESCLTDEHQGTLTLADDTRPLRNHRITLNPGESRLVLLLTSPTTALQGETLDMSLRPLYLTDDTDTIHELDVGTSSDQMKQFTTNLEGYKETRDACTKNYTMDDHGKVSSQSK